MGQACCSQRSPQVCLCTLQTTVRLVWLYWERGHLFLVEEREFSLPKGNHCKWCESIYNTFYNTKCSSLDVTLVGNISHHVFFNSQSCTLCGAAICAVPLEAPLRFVGSPWSTDWWNPNIRSKVAQRQSWVLPHWVWLSVFEAKRTAFLDRVLQNHSRPWGKEWKLNMPNKSITTVII